MGVHYILIYRTNTTHIGLLIHVLPYLRAYRLYTHIFTYTLISPNAYTYLHTSSHTKHI